MKDPQAIESVYSQVDDFLESVRLEIRVHGDARILKRQQINDQAHFILAWGQFESTVKETCREAIRNGQKQREWKQQRAWLLYNAQDQKLSGLSFEAQLSLVP